MTPDLHALISQLVVELDHCQQLLRDDRRQRHPLADRARALLAEADGPAVPDGREPASVALQPSDGEVAELVAELRADAEYAEVERYDMYNMTADQMRRAAFLLEQRHPAPAPVNERPWERDGWCDEQGRCWWTANKPGPLPPVWWMVYIPQSCTNGIMLPAHALPTPETTHD